MRRCTLAAALLWLSVGVQARAAAESVAELHQQLVVASPTDQRLAITLDACGGGVDLALLQTLITLKVPATLFVTHRWLARNAAAVQLLVEHAELFEVENHGDRHQPAVLGSRQRIYGMAPVADVAALQAEVQLGAAAVQAATGRTPQFFRSAGAVYDAAAMRELQGMGVRIAGFSLNADSGAMQPAQVVAKRLLAAKPGDVIIAHMNRPQSGTAQGFAQALPLLQQRGLRFVLLSEAPLRSQP